MEENQVIENQNLENQVPELRAGVALTPATGESSQGAKMSYKSSGESAYIEIPDLQEIPELGGDPEQIDITTLADSVKRSIPGVKDLGDLTFKFLYKKENFLAMQALSGQYSFKIEFSDGLSAIFSAIPNVKMGGAAVNGALTYSIGMSLQSEIAFA